MDGYLGERKVNKYLVNMTLSEKQAIYQAAAAAHISVSRFFVIAALEKAERERRPVVAEGEE